jgi:hypothetical protein
MLAASPTRPGNVVLGSKDLDPSASAHCVWNGMAVTKDGGRSWRDVTLGGPYAQRQPSSPYYGYACNTDPDITFGRDGALYALVEMYNLGAGGAAGPTGENRLQPGWKLVLARSDDGGLTWPLATTLDESAGAVEVLDYSRMAVSPRTGTVLAAVSTFNDLSAYQGAPPYSAVSAIAVRGGGTEPQPPELVFPQEMRLADVAIGDVAAAADGAFVMMAVGEAYDAPTTFYVARSTDDGLSWSAPVAAFQAVAMGRYVNNTQVRTGTHAEMAFAPDGTLYVTYAANDTGNADVYVRTSRDQGRTWSDPVVVGADPAKHAQWHPNVAVGADGVAHLVFFDRAHDPADKLVDITYAQSHDRGRTWTTTRVTSKSFDADLGKHQMGFPFIGDYLGIDTQGNAAWLGFPDTITGTSVVAAAKMVR